MFLTDQELSLLHKAANATIVTKEQHELRKKNLARQICSMFSRGNIALQFGRFTTQEDLDRLAEKNLSRRF